MYYIIIVFFTVVQTIIANWMMDLPVFEASPFTIRLWCNYLAATLVLWCPLLFTSKRRWTYVVAILLDIWFIGNLMYFRSYGDVLNRWCLQNASNLDGIWGSVLPFLSWGDLFFPFITLFWIVLSETIHWDFLSPLWKRLATSILSFLILCLPQTLIREKAALPISPFDTYYTDLTMGRIWYMHTFGAITHFANETVNLVARRERMVIPLEDEELAIYIRTPDSVSMQGNLLIILFESLEDRTIGLQVNGQEVTPNINRLVANSNTGHYSMLAQVKEGKSSDAQLIIFNGLLPISNGAASMRYAANTYPSLVKYFQADTKLLFAAYPYHMWNQHMNAFAYGFDSLYAQDISDRVLADTVVKTIRTTTYPFLITTVTIASHTPCIRYADSSSLNIENILYDNTQSRYLRCVNYTDNAIGRIIDAVLEDSILAQTTRIVITGDHPYFDLSTPVPFIIYDPFISPIMVNRTLYQIDIYTTLVERMHIATPWKGFGKNISDTCIYTAEEIRNLESLSDRLIRTNYFKTSFQKKL